MKKILLSVAFLVGSVASAAAACTSPAVMHDFAATSFNMSFATAPDTNCEPNNAITTWGGVTLGAPSNYGTSPGAVAVIGVNAFVTNVPAVSQSGTWNVTNVSGTVSLPTGASTSALQTTGNTALTTLNTTLGTPMQMTGGSVAPSTLAAWGLVASTQNGATPTNGQLAMGQFNTAPTTITAGNVSPLQMDNAGNLLVNIKAGASSGAVAQGSTTAGQTGSLVQGAVTTASPTYTTAQTSPLSLDTSGNLRVNVVAGGAGGGAVFGPTAVGSANANPPVVIGGTATGAAGQNVAGAAVKAASTQAASTDTSLVVQENPNGPLIAAINGASTVLAGTTPTTQTAATSGTVTKLQSDLNGNLYIAPSQVLTTGTAGTASAAVVTVQGIASGTTLPVQQSSQYPVGATPLTASATGTTAATTATLAGTSGKTTYLCGFSIRANATAAATGNSTVTGTITATLNFTQWTAPAASGIGLTEQVFTPCVPASATNTGIAVISAAPGTGGVVSSTAWGYQL